MTDVLHTADVHLRQDAEKRLDALSAVLEVATTADVDVLTIGGDLFDRPEDVEELRSELRNRYFTDLPFDVVLIPGNHDVEAFRSDLFFGDSCTVFVTEDPYGTWVNAEERLKIVAIPYQETVTDELLLALANREQFSGTEVMVFHGSLDAPIGADSGSEDAYRYFPVTEDLLSELGFDYYLAGHYHGSHYLQFDTGGEFAYPGTPVSTRSSETGPRQVVRVDSKEGLEFISLPTFHHLEKHVTVTPGAESTLLAELEDWVETTVTANAKPTIHLQGVIEQSESEFFDDLYDVADPAWIREEIVSGDHILTHPVIREFQERLEDEEFTDSTNEEVWTRTLRIASQIASAGGLE